MTSTMPEKEIEKNYPTSGQTDGVTQNGSLELSNHFFYNSKKEFCQNNSTYKNILYSIQQLYKPGETFEVSLIAPQVRKHWIWNNNYTYGKNPIVSGWFQDFEKAANFINIANEQVNPISINISLNPVSEALLGRANEKFKTNPDRTQNQDVLFRKWLLIDLDPNRPKGISSTNEEKEAALKLARKVYSYLNDINWPEPLVADSCNGYHLIYRINLCNDEKSKDIITSCLNGLAQKFNTEQVTIDSSVSDAARLVKCWGTRARKGEHIPERPFRDSGLIYIPETIEEVSIEQLQELVSDNEKEKKQLKTNKNINYKIKKNQLDLERYLKDYNVDVVETKKYGNSTLYLLEKWIFDPNHTAKEASIGQTENGIIFYQCFHSSCQGRNWAEARRIISGNDSLKCYMLDNQFPFFDLSSQNIQKNLNSIIPALGNFSLSSHFSQDRYEKNMTFESETKPEPTEDIFYGLAGEFVDEATKYSEADPVAVLATLLIRFGAEVGRGAYIFIGDQIHHARLFGVLVGASSKARKGTAAAPVTRLFDNITDEHKKAAESEGPLSSGEGLIWTVRDPHYEWRINKKTNEGYWIMDDPGSLDKRVFIKDEELSTALQCTKREGNTLSSIIRCAYDGGKIEPLTKNNRISATNAHICILTHITEYELNNVLDKSQTFNGFANRFFWLYVKRKKYVALPKSMDKSPLLKFADRFNDAIKVAQEAGEIKLSEEAEDYWRKIYPEVSQEHPGMIGVILNRAETHILRIALVYALLDKSHTIETKHLEVARAFWDFAEQSTKYIFGNSEINSTQNKILKVLKQGTHSTKDLYNAFNKHISQKELNNSLSKLIHEGKVVQDSKSTQGRPIKIYYLAKNAKNSKKG